jgi:putative addiction module antidote
MLRKVFKTGNSVVVSLPKQALSTLNISEGSDVNIEVNEKEKKLIITLADQDLKEQGITLEFSKQIDRFIEKYRPALEELAK